MHDDKTATDDRVTTLFHDTTADVEVDVAALVRGGITRGRAKHRLHTAGTALAAAVGVAGVVGVALTVPGLGSGGDGGTGIAPAGASATTSTTAKPTPSTTAKPYLPGNGPTKKGAVPPPATADIPVKAASLPATFAQLFPGKITQAEKRTGRIMDGGNQYQIAHFLWKGHTTTVAFSAYHGTPAEACQAAVQDAKLAGRQPLSCVKRPDGSFLSSAFGQEPAVDGGGSANIATLYTTDHYDISILSYTYSRKGGPNLSSKPPLSQEQLKQAVTSKAWF